MNGRCETDPFDRAVDVCRVCYGEFCWTCIVEGKGRQQSMCHECALIIGGLRPKAKPRIRGDKKTVKARREALKEVRDAPVHEVENLTYFDKAPEQGFVSFDEQSLEQGPINVDPTPSAPTAPGPAPYLQQASSAQEHEKATSTKRLPGLRRSGRRRRGSTEPAQPVQPEIQAPTAPAAQPPTPAAGPQTPEPTAPSFAVPSQPVPGVPSQPVPGEVPPLPPAPVHGVTPTDVGPRPTDIAPAPHAPTPDAALSPAAPSAPPLAPVRALDGPESSKPYTFDAGEPFSTESFSTETPSPVAATEDKEPPVGYAPPPWESDLEPDGDHTTPAPANAPEQTFPQAFPSPAPAPAADLGPEPQELVQQTPGSKTLDNGAHADEPAEFRKPRPFVTARHPGASAKPQQPIGGSPSAPPEEFALAATPKSEADEPVQIHDDPWGRTETEVVEVAPIARRRPDPKPSEDSSSSSSAPDWTKATLPKFD